MNQVLSKSRLAALLAWSATAAFAQVRDIPQVPLQLGGAAISGSATGAAPANLQLPSPALQKDLALAPAVIAAPKAEAAPGAGAGAPASAVLGETARAAQTQPAPLAEARSPAGQAAQGPLASPARALPGAPAASGEGGGHVFGPTAGRSDLSVLFDGGRAAGAEESVERHLEGFARFTRGIMGPRKPDERQARALLEAYLEDEQAAPGSKLALELERRLLPPKPTVSPRFRDYAPVLLKLSAESGVPVARLEAMIREHGLLEILAGPEDSEALESALSQILTKEELSVVTSRYPKTEQGEAMRRFGEQVASRSGTSVEEMSRAGAFLYVDFTGRAVRRAYSGRDPDLKTADVVFYGVRSREAWKFGVYRQNPRPGVRGPDAEYERALKKWLVAGGVPEDDLAF